MIKKKQNVVEYIYEQTEIHFLINPENENVMVNATEMGKIFGKQPSDFTKTDSTNHLIDCMCSDEHFYKIFNLGTEYIPSQDRKIMILETKSTGKNNGTWMHRYLALDFASWLDPNFKLWILQTIDSILFQHYNVHRKKVIEIEKSKAKIEDLKNKIIQSQDKNAIDLLKEQEILKELQKDKSKAIIDQTKIIQLELFKNEKNDK